MAGNEMIDAPMGNITSQIAHLKRRALRSRNWCSVLNHFMIVFDERLSGQV